ncbi:PDC sensor domain-containing protein [Hymenobacter terricola]|uniref:hypothetical protein n=1 Tax=Hymenobacter terricola TaxID=2819236 RepID=UPI001B306005|nr:hypothetical protein [Hymenobacter terricola]
MKNSFFAAVGRNIGTLALSVAIVLGMSYYLLSYVPQRTASLNYRYFRVLARIGQNMKDKIEAQHFNDESDALAVAHRLADKQAANGGKTPLSRPGGKPAKTTTAFSSQAEVATISRVLRARESAEASDVLPAQVPGTPLKSVALTGSQFVFERLIPLVAGAKAEVPASGRAVGLRYRLTHTLPADTLVRDLLRTDVFDYFFMVELPSNRLFYSSGPTDLYLNTASAEAVKGAKMPRWLTDSTLTHTGRAGALLVGGHEYQLFAQPVQLAPGLTCLLVGGVAGNRFNAERRELPTGWPELILGLLLLGILSLPFLKLLLMNPREQIDRGDVLLCAASLVLGSGILLLTLQAAVSRYSTEPRVLHQQLAGLAKDVATDLHGELTELNTIARNVDDSLKNAQVDSLRFDASGAVRTVLRPYPCRAYSHRGATPGDYFTWISRQGEARYGLDPTPLAAPVETAGKNAQDDLSGGKYYVPSLLKRPYLKQMNAQAYQLVRGDSYALDSAKQIGAEGYTPPAVSTDTCYFDMLRTVQNTSALSPASTGSRAPMLKALLARPSRWRPGLICAFETPLLSFDDQILPPGFGYCLLERNGNVMIHSKPELNLSENLLTDCEPAAPLRAALFAQTSTALEAVYQGKPTLLFVHPMPGMHRSLVTFFDMSYAKAQQSQTSLLGLTLLGGFWLLGVAFWALRRLVVPRTPGQEQLTNPDSFRSLWPHPTHAARYWHVVVGIGVGLLAFGAVATRVGPLSQLCLLLVVPGLLYVLTYHHTRLRPDYSRRTHHWVVGLMSGLLLLLLACHWAVVGGRETAWVAGLVLGLGGVVWWLLRGGLVRWLGRRGIALARGYRLAYVWMLLGWIVLLGIVPALTCYHIAHLAERLQQARYAQLHILRLNEQRHTQANTFHYYTTWFFGSGLKYDAGVSLRDAVKSAPRELAALEFFASLGAEMNKPSEDAGQVLTNDSTTARAWRPWQVSSLAQDPITLVSQDNPSRGRVETTLEGLHWGYPRTWPAGRWALIVLVAALVLVLQALVRYLVRRLFGLREDAPTPLPQTEALAAPVCRLWLLPAGSTWADAPAWARQELGQPAIVLNCQQLFKPESKDSESAALASLPSPPVAATAPHVVVLANFDCFISNADLTRRKCEFLTELQRRGWPLLVLSATHPVGFGDCGHPLEQQCQVSGHSEIREAGELLLDTLAEFRVEYFALNNVSPKPVPADAEHQLIGSNLSLRRFFERECQLSPFVASLRPAIVANLWRRREPGVPLSRTEIVTVVQRLAQFHFRRLWLALSPQERFLLFDLAQDGLVNSDDRRPLDNLLRKGFLRFSGHGRLGLSSTSFRDYLLTAQRRREALRYAQADPDGSSWASAQTPLMLLLAAGALFIFISQPNILTQTQGFVVALTSLIPAIFGLLKFILPSSKVPSQPAA